MSNYKKIFSLILSGMGALILLIVLLPLGISALRFSFFSSPQFIDPAAPASRSPLPRIMNALGITTIDYSQPSNWFDTSSLPLPTPAVSLVRFYALSVPRLGLSQVSVEINGQDLKKNAIHFPGSALPGRPGNSVVFGHSSLPQLYRKGNPLTIFNPLPKIRVGDEIIVQYDGVTYKYLVRRTFEVKPSQTEVLFQDASKYELSLITCVPLGTYWRRFVARAELVN